MSRKLILVSIVLFILGCLTGALTAVFFGQRVMTASLGVRLLGELNQDAAMFVTLKMPTMPRALGCRKCA